MILSFILSFHVQGPGRLNQYGVANVASYTVHGYLQHHNLAFTLFVVLQQNLHIPWNLQPGPAPCTISHGNKY